MITVVIVKNAFEPENGREVHRIEYRKETVVNDYIKSFTAVFSDMQPIEGDDYVISLNSYQTSGNVLVKDNDFIVISPVVAKGSGKNPFVLVAAIALSVVSMGIGANVAGVGFTGALSGASGWAAIGGYLAAAATMYIGGMLIQRVFGTVAETNDSSSSNPTYNWGAITTTSGQNNSISNFYGTVRTGGQTIGKYLSTVDDKQYLNWLIAVGEGPLEISDIRINENPVANYSNVTIETRPGTYDQEVIQNFNDTISTKSLGYEILADQYRTDIVTGSATQGIIVYTECSNGLYYANDDGGLDTAWVKIVIEYALIGTSNWIRIGEYKLSGNKSSAIRNQFRIDNLSPGEYQIRCIVTGRSHDISSSRAQTRIWWTSVAGIVYDDFAYPGISLVAIKALATDQLSGSPNVTMMVNRANVYVWNPTTQLYETHDATNPAWAAYDFVHQCHYIKNVSTGKYEYLVKGAKADIMLYDRFAEWASYCDKFNLKVNIEMNSPGEMILLCNSFIGSIGRGKVELFGTKYGPTWDGPKDPVQMFGNGNIIAGTFERTFTKTSDRANAVEITFTNKEKDYQRDTVTVYSDHYDMDEYDNKTQINYDGITDPAQAIREGKFQMACNDSMNNGAKWTSDIQAIACTIGDVVYVASDIPKWGCSGHIIAVTDNIITVNRLMDDYDSAKHYRFAYRDIATDTRFEVNIAAIVVNADDMKVTLAYVPEIAPSIGDIFDIAETSKGIKKMVIKSITRAQDFTRQLEGLYYDENIFLEKYDIPEIDYTSSRKNVAQNVIKLTGSNTLWTSADGIKKSKLYISWAMPDNAGFTRFAIYLSSDKCVSWKEYGSSTSMDAQIDVDYGYDYYVRILTIYGVSVSSGVILYIPIGTDAIPPDITGIDSELMASGIRRYHWTFEYPEPNDIAGFRMKYIQGSIVNWEAGIPVQEGLITSQPYETQTIRQGIHSVMIKAVDNAGNESKNFAYCILDMGDLIQQNVLDTTDFGENNWASVKTNGEKHIDDGSIYPPNTTLMWSKDSDAMWNTPDSNMWDANFQQYSVLASMVCQASGQFWIDYEIEGPAIVYYRKVGMGSFWNNNPNGYFWTGDNDAIWDDSNDMWKQWSDRLIVKAGEHLEIKIVALNNSSEKTIIKKLIAYIDVPDRTEHFENITVPVAGLSLPVNTPHYYTTSVRIDAVQSNASGIIMLPKIVSRNPCVIQLLDTGGNAVSGTIDCTWQGYQKEEIT